ncbi:MAG: PIG-L family deacetylase [Planctomycetota bacterium]|jgi:LmbE family N-acetylglucosaminyl deacetylase|nr:PIG-L family deacetylase [Planctomycetota bacterium]
MGRFFPCPLGRPQNVLVMPEVGECLPTQRPGFLHGDPRLWIPGTFQLIETQGGQAPLPWTAESDLLLAPAPAPGPETDSLRTVLKGLPKDYPVALYERDIPVWPNLLLSAEGQDGGLHFTNAANGLRGYRSAFRHRGRGGAEALLVMPTQFHLNLLDRSWRLELLPRSGKDLLNRRHLATALDHQRSLVEVVNSRHKSKLQPVSRIAVVMPHFDDDILQCGAAMLQALDAGTEVRMIWLTDGRKGITTVSEEESARIRHQEAKRAMDILGVTDMHFLDAPETELKKRGPWTAKLHELLKDYRPERVFTVWWADNNIDHFEANRVLQAAWPSELDATIAASGLWQPLPLTCGVAIDADLRARKDEALLAYASQIAEVDYLRVDHGLGRWYARDSQADWLEAFWELPANEYWKAFKRSGCPKRLFL